MPRRSRGLPAPGRRGGRRRDGAEQAAPHQGAGARAVPSPRPRHGGRPAAGRPSAPARDGDGVPAPGPAASATSAPRCRVGASSTSKASPAIRTRSWSRSRPEASGGRTTAAGAGRPCSTGESSITIGDIAVADPEAQVVYVGTGENNSSRSSYAGTGVFKTTDGGKTWANVGLHDSHHIGRIIVDRANPDVVYVAALGHLYTENAERGVYKSSDGGRTWERVLFVDDRTGAIDVVQHPSRPEVLYAATWERARTAANFLESGPGSGIWRSTDSGRTWSRLAGGLPTGATVGRIGLDVSPARPETGLRRRRQPVAPAGDRAPRRGHPAGRAHRAAPARAVGGGLRAPRRRRPSTGSCAPTTSRRRSTARSLKRDVKAGKITIADLIAYLQDANRDLFEREIVGSEMFRSDDGGTTWKRTHEGRLEKIYYSYGYYFGRVHVDPTDADRVYFGGVPMLGSADGGRTWRGLDERGVHVDHHALFIDPRAPNRLALGNDGGLNLSFDHGETWTKVNNVPVGQFTTLALDNAEPYNILGGLQDNGVMRGPSTYNPGKSDPARVEVDLRRRRQRGRPGPQGPQRRLRRLPVRQRVAAQPEDGRAGEDPAAARALRREEGEAAPLQLGRPDPDVAALARRPVLRRQSPLPVVRPRRHLDGDLRGPHRKRRAGRRALRHHHLHRGVAEAVRRPLRRDRRREGLGQPRRRPHLVRPLQRAWPRPAG